ncbi:MAG TPA: hypothetical protein PLL90_06800 [Bacteroidales bacterium]|nr:hypothetical protein [Bacteroidales bacterium]
MKSLKIFFVFIFCNTLLFNGFTQSTTCKFDVDKTDATTNTKIQKIKTKLTGTDVFYVLISRNDTSYVFSLNFWISGALREVIEKNEKVSISLSGGETLYLYSIARCKPIPHYGDQAWTEYLVDYPIRSEDLEKMKTMKPLSLKLNVGIEPFNRVFNKNDVEKLRDIIRCIMKD